MTRWFVLLGMVAAFSVFACAMAMASPAPKVEKVRAEEESRGKKTTGWTITWMDSVSDRSRFIACERIDEKAVRCLDLAQFLRAMQAAQNDSAVEIQ